jgi:protein-arginine kinase activator protein McsA
MSTKDKINRKVYRETLKAAAKYFHNREDFEREDELRDELRSFDKIQKKKRKHNEE